jgi:hypothetical protein
MKYTDYTDVPYCDIEVTEEVTFFNCLNSTADVKTKDMVKADKSFHVNSKTKDEDIDFLTEGFVNVYDDKTLQLEPRHTVTYLDRDTMEFTNKYEDTFGEIETEKLKDSLGIDPDAIHTILRVKDTIIVHEMPNILKLYAIDRLNKEFTPSYVQQTIVLDTEQHEDPVMPAKAISATRIVI